MRESERANARQHPCLWRWGCGTAGVSTAHPTQLKLATSCCCIACALQTLQNCPAGWGLPVALHKLVLS